MALSEAPSTNRERESRILDAAADLFVHFGYDKTTVDDIARTAGVSKGAIYLHFKGKDALFEGLLIRELFTFGEQWLAHLEEDPSGVTIGGMYKAMLYALNENPFMAAIFKQDRQVFGTYLRKPGNFFRTMSDQQTDSGTAPRYIFVKLMQEAGAMHTDLDPAIVAHIMDMLAYGLVAIEGIKPTGQIPPMEAVIEGIALIMDRALTVKGSDPEIGKRIVRELAETGRQQYAALLKQKQESQDD
jgi:AcrR family transcriptional regulator